MADEVLKKINFINKSCHHCIWGPGHGENSNHQIKYEILIKIRFPCSLYIEIER